MYIISETSVVSNTPQNIRKLKGRIRFEACLQTHGDINRNKRRYGKSILDEGISKISERMTTGTFLGELDHPIDTNPVRQTTVLYKAASHRIMETGWDGNKLIGVVESLRTPNGTILKNLAEDGIPVGFSFRGMGDLRAVNESGSQVFEVVGPLHCITWDSVSFPSHEAARLIKITEGVVHEMHQNVGMGCQSLNESLSRILHDFKGINEDEETGMICTNEGICYIPNEFDKLVEQRVINLVDKFTMR